MRLLKCRWVSEGGGGVVWGDGFNVTSKVDEGGGVKTGSCLYPIALYPIPLLPGVVFSCEIFLCQMILSHRRS